MKKVYWLSPLIFLGIVLGFWYFPTLSWLWNEWFAPTPEVRFYSHGPLVLLISFLLVIRERRVLTNAQPCLKGIPVVLLGLTLGIIAWLQHFPALSAYSLLVLFIGILLVVCGWEVTRRWLFPLLFLTLAIPFPFTEQLGRFLAKIVATGSVALAEVAGVAAAREGTRVVVGSYSYSVEPLCSSLNIMLALFTLVLPLLYLKGYPWRKAVFFLLPIPVVALVFKIILITFIFRVTEVSGQEVALKFYHGWAGLLGYWFSLLVILLPLVFLTRFELRRALAEVVR